MDGGYVSDLSGITTDRGISAVIISVPSSRNNNSQSTIDAVPLEVSRMNVVAYLGSIAIRPKQNEEVLNVLSSTR